jgi:toxin ParE1/3/4
MKRLLVHPAAADEFEEAVVFLESRAKGLGVAFRREVECALVRLQAGPGQYPPQGRTGFRKCFVDRFPYTVFFLEMDEVIWVAAIAHGRRKPGYWRDRERRF